jgi:hypothetical protein
MWLRRIGVMCALVAVCMPAGASTGCSTTSNIALGRSVTVTVVNNDADLAYEGESPSDITDGSIAYISAEQKQNDGCVGWRNSVCSRMMTVTMQINLGSTCTISAIRYNPGNVPFATLAADKMTTPLGTTDVNGAPNAWTTHYAAATIEASTVTITLTKTNTASDRDWMFIGEIEVYGKVVEMPPEPVGVLLPVTFMAQFYNNDNCGHGSCGPASLSMCAAYALGRAPSSQDIMNVWSYLGGDICGNDPNGTSLTQLRNAARAWPFGLVNVSYVSITSLQTIRNELDAGRPMVVHVVCKYLSNRGYTYKGGHYVAVIGYDEDHIICNDPATHYNQPKYYSNSEMLAAILDTSGNTGGLRYFYR